MYDYYHERRQSKKAFTISKSIGYYLEKIVAPRFVDVDQSIRETAFEAAGMIMERLEGEVMSEQLLHKMFISLFEERVEVIDLFVKLVGRLMDNCRDGKVLTEYLMEHLGKLMELSRNTQFTQTNMQALRIIERLHHNEPGKKILNRDYLVSLLEIYAPQTLLYALHAVV